MAEAYLPGSRVHNEYSSRDELGVSWGGQNSRTCWGVGEASWPRPISQGPGFTMSTRHVRAGVSGEGKILELVGAWVRRRGRGLSPRARVHNEYSSRDELG